MPSSILTNSSSAGVRTRNRAIPLFTPTNRRAFCSCKFASIGLCNLLTIAMLISTRSFCWALKQSSPLSSLTKSRSFGNARALVFGTTRINSSSNNREPPRSVSRYFSNRDPYSGGGSSYSRNRPGRNSQSYRDSENSFIDRRSRYRENRDYNSDYDFTPDEYDDAGDAARRPRRTNTGRDNHVDKGRSRYSTDGRKKERSGRSLDGRGRGGRGRGRGRGRGGGRSNGRERSQEQRKLERPPTPSLASRPTYFTCRHTYESALRQELQRSIAAQARAKSSDIAPNYKELVSFSKPHPGLVLVSTEDDAIASFLSTLRPTYALQTLSNCVVVQAESIKGLAKAVLGSQIVEQGGGLLRSELVSASRGSLAVHALVPEMGRGMPEPNLPQYRRATKIGEEIAAQLQKRCKAARKANADDECHEKWLLQIMLLEPQVVAASFSRCRSREPSSPGPHWTWPSWNLPAGLAYVELDEGNDGGYDDDDDYDRSPREGGRDNTGSHVTVPSSAYRKLLEAFWYLGERPPSSSPHPVIDLGACPGGWTGALRRMGCSVVAVDRSPLDEGLMGDPRVTYVGGDAFRYVPPWARNENDHWPGKTLGEPVPNTWMVSDIIAYPDKITELLDHWCGRNWISHAIVTIKFQSEIPWEDVENATAIVRGHGYDCRTVHFFNNKNEITFLAVKEGCSNDNNDSSNLLGKPMYSPILPNPKKK